MNKANLNSGLAGEARRPSSGIAVDDGKGEYLVDVCQLHTPADHWIRLDETRFVKKPLGRCTDRSRRGAKRQELCSGMGPNLMTGAV